jgi:hypothetical protein
VWGLDECDPTQSLKRQYETFSSMAAPKDPGLLLGRNDEYRKAEMFLPFQALEPSNICINEPYSFKTSHTAHSNESNQGEQTKTIALLSYKTSVFTLPSLNILTQFCRVSAWDSATGRLDLEIDPTSITASKCIALQDFITTTLKAKPSWLPVGQRKPDDISANFQKLLYNGILTVYLHGANPEKKVMGRAWQYMKGIWERGVGPGSFKKGQQIRVALRFQGLCFITLVNGVVRYRLQHQTVCIYHKA